MKSKTLATLGGVVLMCLSLNACAPLMVAGFAGTAIVASDRRTSGAQLEDETIELRGSARIRDALGEKAHVNVTSFNRTALITGEVATEADRAAAEQAVSRIENIRATVNELAVAGSASLTSRSNDLILTSKVKAAYFEAKDLQFNAIKVVAERGTVFLMGRVTEREAARATELARGFSGVTKVVRVFEVITEAELARIQPPASK